MYLNECKSNYELEEYLSFISRVYKTDLNYKDNIKHIARSILYKKSIFNQNAIVLPYVARESDGKIKAVVTYIVAKNMPDVLQLSFFEALPNEGDAVDLIIDRAIVICKQRGIKSYMVGLNGHVNYGLGILVNDFDKPSTFGGAYNPPYYAKYLYKYNMDEYLLTSFIKDMSTFSLEREKPILEKIKKKYTFRKANFKNFKSEMKIYTELNNACFKDHLFYYPRTNEEDYELFKDLKYFIKEENLLIAELDGEPIGFMLWYPDFNQLIPPQGSAGIGTVIKNKLFGNKIDTFKMVEIGILPQYQSKGVILGLFEMCSDYTKGRYKSCKSSWILDENLKSKSFGIRWAESVGSQYKVFVKDV